MQLLECLHAEPLGMEFCLEGLDVPDKLDMLPLVEGVGRAVVFSARWISS